MRRPVFLDRDRRSTPRLLHRTIHDICPATPAECGPIDVRSRGCYDNSLSQATWLKRSLTPAAQAHKNYTRKWDHTTSTSKVFSLIRSPDHSEKYSEEKREVP